MRGPDDTSTALRRIGSLAEDLRDRDGSPLLQDALHRIVAIVDDVLDQIDLNELPAEEVDK